MTVTTITAMHGRPAITEIFLENQKRLAEECQWAELRVVASVTAGNSANIDLCYAYGVDFIETPNSPLGKKWNAAAIHAMKKPFDYLLIMGSDDLIDPALLTNYQRWIQTQIPFFGVPDLYFLNTEKREALRFHYHGATRNTVGAGRMIHRKAVMAAGGKLWADDKESSLENSCEQILRRRNVRMQVFTAHPYPGIIDLKSKENMWSFERFRTIPGVTMPRYEDATAWLSPTENTLISKLHDNGNHSNI